jgi:hypothetical protein
VEVSKSADGSVGPQPQFTTWQYGICCSRLAAVQKIHCHQNLVVLKINLLLCTIFFCDQ